MDTLMVMHSVVTPESSGRGLGHSTFFLLIFTFYATTGCAAKMLLAITQPPLQMEVAGKSLTLKCLKPRRHYTSKRLDSISGRVRRIRIFH